MTKAKTEILSAGKAGLARAAALLRDGQLVAFPTETVYGLGADATNARAVAEIFAAKGRPRFNPLIVHVGSVEEAVQLVEMDPLAHRLARAFWPGPMTLVLPLRGGATIPGIVTAGLETLAIRVPASPVAQQLIAAFGGPVAAPSANPSGRISPTSAAHVVQGLGGRIAAVVDAGPCAVGVESTILRLRGGEIEELRAGGLPAEEVARVTGLTPRPAADAPGAPGSPGQLRSHYAPMAAVRLDAARPAPDEVWLGFGPDCAGADLSLSESGDLAEAAARLFEALHRIDRVARDRGVHRIAVAPVPETGLGRAINDRLRRAAAPRG